MGKGRMVGDIDWIDWFAFTSDPLYSFVGNNYFGELSNRNIKTLCTERFRETRTCRCCGRPLNLYTGFCDLCGEEATHMFDSSVHAFASDAEAARRAIDTLRPRMKAEGMTLTDLTPKVAKVVSMKEVVDNIASADPLNRRVYQRPPEPRQVAR